MNKMPLRLTAVLTAAGMLLTLTGCGNPAWSRISGFSAPDDAPASEVYTDPTGSDNDVSWSETETTGTEATTTDSGSTTTTGTTVKSTVQDGMTDADVVNDDDLWGDIV